MQDGFIKVAAVTPKTRIADVGYNIKNICHFAAEAAKNGAKIIVFPELSITGYACGTLFLQDALLNHVERAVLELKQYSSEIDALIFVGTPYRVDSKLYNTMIAFNRGKILGIIPKTFLPNYDEFSELRYFSPAGKEVKNIKIDNETVLFGTRLLFESQAIKGLCVAAEICADLWVPVAPSSLAAKAGATIIVNGSASNEIVDKKYGREQMVVSQSARLIAGYIYTNPGLEESTESLIFSGHNIIAENGELLAAKQCWHSGIVYSEIDLLRLTHERSKNNNFENDVDSTYERVDFEIESQKVSISRRFYRTPFMAEDIGEKNEQCEQLIELLTMSVIHQMQERQEQEIWITGRNVNNMLVSLYVSCKAFDFLGLDKTKIFISGNALRDFEEHQMLKEVSQLWGGTCDSQYHSGMKIKSISLTEYVLNVCEDECRGDIYGLTAGVPQSMLDVLTDYIIHLEGDERLISPYEMFQYDVEDFCLYYAMKYGYERKKICRLAELQFIEKYESDEIRKRVEKVHRSLLNRIPRTGWLRGPKVISIIADPLEGW